MTVDRQPTPPTPTPQRAQRAGRSGLDAATRQRLRDASTAELTRLIDLHGTAIGPEEARFVLRNPHVTGEILDALGAIRPLIAHYEIRRLLARHPRTPEHLALRFVPGLYWRDLLELSIDMRLRPSLRAAGERYLGMRLPKLAVGEKLALARRAGSEVRNLLRRDPSPRVIAALLDNPRLTERQLLALASDPEAAPRALDHLARHPRWGVRREIRAALALNPRAPFAAVFDALPTLASDDLAAVANAEALPAIVRHRAKTLLEARPHPSPRAELLRSQPIDPSDGHSIKYDQDDDSWIVLSTDEASDAHMTPAASRRRPREEPTSHAERPPYADDP
ncbi:MAG: hypothetical protein AAF772_01185 [Acidobacteriota bacterium]